MNTVVAQVDNLTEGGFVARLKPDADLDQAMLEIADWWISEGADYWASEEDFPTAIPADAWGQTNQVAVGWYRKQPCICGEGHGWDLYPAKPGPGAFLAVVGS